MHFVDGSRSDYDLIVLATGYRLHYPFVDPALLDWTGMAPDLYLNVFSRRDPNLFVLGMIEASGIGWQGRYEQAELVASVTSRPASVAPARAAAFEERPAGPPPDLSGGYHYLGLERMAYYVNKDAYRRAVRKEIEAPRRCSRDVPPRSPLATDVDDIKIVFNESSLTTLKIVIGLILFGIALDTDLEDFKRAARRPVTDRDRRRRAVRAAAGDHAPADAAARRARLGRARHDPGGLLPAGERVQHPHPPRGRRRGAVGLDDRGLATC